MGLIKYDNSVSEITIKSVIALYNEKKQQQEHCMQMPMIGCCLFHKMSKFLHNNDNDDDDNTDDAKAIAIPQVFSKNTLLKRYLVSSVNPLPHNPNFNNPKERTF